MKLSKPFVNLTKSKATGVYTLNSVVSLPKDYALCSIEQGLITKKGKKIWAVTASFTTNGSLETDIVEFAVPLKQEPSKEIKKVCMIVKAASVMGSPIGKSIDKPICNPTDSPICNPEEDNGTDVNYDDADITIP